jgi:hypothetical protein
MTSEKTNVSISVAPESDDTLTKADGAISTNVMRKMELGGALCILTKIIEAAPSSSVMGMECTYADPICEALHRLINHQSHLVTEREIIPGNRQSIERLLVDELKYNTNNLRELLAFKKANSVLTEGEDSEAIISDMVKWYDKRVDIVPVVYADTSGEVGEEGEIT